MSESILIIDNSVMMIQSIRSFLTSRITKNIASYQATSKTRAWEGIQSMSAETVIIPLHLSEDKSYEGLWLADRIYNSDLNILKIIIISNLSFQKRQAIINLTDFINLHVPHFVSISKCFTEECDCKKLNFSERKGGKKLRIW